MRLYKYLSLSSNDDDVSSFRSLNIALVEKKTNNMDLVERIQTKYEMVFDADMLIEKANKELKLMYRGKFLFDYCLEEQGLPPENIKVGSQKVRMLKEKWFKFNDELSTIQDEFERKIKKSLQK